MKLTPEKLTAFCAALAETGIIARACEAVGISRQTAYSWRDDIPEFAAAWDKARQVGITALEDEAHRRAFEGFDEPVFYGGAKVGAMRRYSDTLTIFLLKAHSPEKYRDNSRMEVTGANGGPVQLTDGDRAAKIAAILAAAEVRRDAQATTPSDDVNDLV